MTRFVSRARRAVGVRGAVDVLVTGNRDMRALNARYRNADTATDVLSFPPGSFANGFAGDIAISAEIAAQNARLLGYATPEEIKILVLHGVLHLAGYDHERDDGEMARQETRLRRLLGLPLGLIERHAGSGRHSRSRKASSRASSVPLPAGIARQRQGRRPAKRVR